MVMHTTLTSTCALVLHHITIKDLLQTEKTAQPLGKLGPKSEVPAIPMYILDCKSVLRHRTVKGKLASPAVQQQHSSISRTI
jgi:hypothetical protein